MSKAPPVPRILFDMALKHVDEPLAVLVESGADVDDHVWVYFDGRAPPGRDLAIKHLMDRGATLEQATQKVHATIKSEREAGNVFAFGIMTTRAGFLALLGHLGGGGPGIAELETWLGAPAPEKQLRVVIIAGSQIQMQLVQLK